MLWKNVTGKNMVDKWCTVDGCELSSVSDVKKIVCSNITGLIYCNANCGQHLLWQESMVMPFSFERSLLMFVSRNLVFPYLVLAHVAF